MIHTGINEYFVFPDGNILNKKTGKLIKWCFNKSNGYFTVKLSDGPIVHTRYVHRIVCLAYHGDSYFVGADVNHEDGNKANNHKDNLKWCTRKYNINHAFENKLTSHKGSKNANSILNEKDVATIKRHISCGNDLGYIAKLFSVHRDTIRSIRDGKNWSHV